MSADLNDFLKDWSPEARQLKVRKIIGSDGKEKVQLRVDLGVLQMETAGRPDGVRPHGVESLLVYHQKKAADAEARAETYSLTPDDCATLQQEGVQYYHRYVSLFQLTEWAGVIRDTQRNLNLFAFVAKHAPNEEIAWSFQQFRPYVMMMNTRAKASRLIDRGQINGAVRTIEDGREMIQAFYQEIQVPEMAARSPELAFLIDWLEEVRSKKPLSKLEKLQQEMERAIEIEAYERAAELRDAIRAHDRRRVDP